MTVEDKSENFSETTQSIIAAEVQKDIAEFIESGDLETAEFMQAVMQDLRQTTFEFLSKINKSKNPRLVLYPSSGFDRIPKLAFGDNKVIHTSLETFHGGDQPYFDQLGSGLNTIAEPADLPFANSSFDVICLLDSQDKIIGSNPDVFLRLLRPGGLIVLCKSHILYSEDDRLETYSQIPSLVSLPVSDGFQMQGDAQLEFAVFQKK